MTFTSQAAGANSCQGMCGKDGCDLLLCPVFLVLLVRLVVVDDIHVDTGLTRLEVMTY